MKDQEIIEELRASLEDDGRATCATMHRVAGKVDVDPIEAATVANDVDIRASQCQLGLFGHGPKEEGKGRIVQSGVEVREEVARRLREVQVDGRMSCATAWEIASEFKLKRLDLGNAVETLGISVAPCQLGFF